MLEGSAQPLAAAHLRQQDGRGIFVRPRWPAQRVALQGVGNPFYREIHREGLEESTLRTAQMSS